MDNKLIRIIMITLLKKSVFVGLLFICSMTSQAQTTSQAQLQELSRKLISKFENNAKRLGLSTVQYSYAVTQMMRMLDPDTEKNPAIVELKSTYEFQQLMTYIEAEEEPPGELQLKLNAHINQQKALVASELGLDVKNLHEFQEMFAKDYAPYGIENVETQYSPSLQASSTTEKITVKCTDQCNFGPSSTQYFNMKFYIYNQASSRYGQLESFTVNFRYSNSNVTFKQEKWRYTHSAGAWFVKELPCDTCQNGDQ